MAVARTSPLTRRIGRHGTRPLAERLGSRLKLDPVTECANWTGYTTPTGYGQIGDDAGRTVATHRAAYVLANGPIPDGLVIDHLCRNRRCCNPDHMEAVPQRLNVLRGESPAAKAARATHCPKGHPYDETNTHRYRGHRFCRACWRVTRAEIDAIEEERAA